MTVAASTSRAHDRIALLADPGSLEAWDGDIVSADPLDFADTLPYAERLRDAGRRTGLSEAVVTGRVTVRGRPLAVVAGEFGFLGGSVGIATAERVARAFERAIEQRLPLLAMPASGGTRMQEGALALMQMAKLAAAARRLRDAGLLYVTYLTDPTTGGVLASWGSLGAVTFAIPGALLGFGGPRVVELMTGRPLPPGVQTAEHLHERGLVDAVVPPERLADRVARLLAVSDARAAPSGSEAQPPTRALRAPARGEAWASVSHARDPRRPAARDLLAAWASDVTELHGDDAGRGDDPACRAGLARLRGVPCVFVVQHRDERGPARMGPVGYRKARRAFSLAAELRLPIVTIVDTPGAELSAAAEQGGLSAEIARTLADMSALAVPTLAILAGEGGSGGALALLAADRVVCAQHASLAPLAPEGASAILFRDDRHAAELAARQGGASWELLADGIVDVVVPEHPSADAEPAAFSARLGGVVEHELRALVASDPRARLAARAHRYRAVGARGWSTGAEAC